MALLLGQRLFPSKQRPFEPVQGHVEVRSGCSEQPDPEAAGPYRVIGDYGFRLSSVSISGPISKINGRAAP